MNVIVFASRKGGSGKSTLAAHLAAHVHKATKPILLVDADPQGSLTLWHKLRGTNEPPIKAAVNSVSGIVAAAKRDDDRPVGGRMHRRTADQRPATRTTPKMSQVRTYLMVISKNLQPAYVSRFLEHSHRNGEPSHPSRMPAHLSVSRQMRQPK